MGLEALLIKLEARAVTAVTPAATRDVTVKPAPVLACTSVTLVTAPVDVLVDDSSACRWQIHFADRAPVEVAFAPSVDRRTAMASYPDATAVTQMAAPPATTIPDDLAEMFEVCLRSGRYEKADRDSLAVMLSIDAVEARALVTQIYKGIESCKRCVHFRRPGLSDGYCIGREDLPIVYGLLRALPEEDGAGCTRFLHREQRF